MYALRKRPVFMFANAETEEQAEVYSTTHIGAEKVVDKQYVPGHDVGHPPCRLGSCCATGYGGAPCVCGEVCLSIRGDVTSFTTFRRRPVDFAKLSGVKFSGSKRLKNVPQAESRDYNVTAPSVSRPACA